MTPREKKFFLSQNVKKRKLKRHASASASAFKFQLKTALTADESSGEGLVGQRGTKLERERRWRQNERETEKEKKKNRKVRESDRAEEGG